MSQIEEGKSCVCCEDQQYIKEWVGFDQGDVDKEVTSFIYAHMVLLNLIEKTMLAAYDNGKVD